MEIKQKQMADIFYYDFTGKFNPTHMITELSSFLDTIRIKKGGIVLDAELYPNDQYYYDDYMQSVEGICIIYTIPETPEEAAKRIEKEEKARKKRATAAENKKKKLAEEKEKKEAVERAEYLRLKAKFESEALDNP